MSPRPQKRTLLMLLLLLAYSGGGAIINVAVAWVVPYAFGEKNQIGWADGTTSYQWFPLGGTQRGWPMPAVCTELPSRWGGTWGTSIEFSNDDGSRIQLGLWPLWPGFAINTLFYAAILWLLFAAPGFIRRRVRRKRGLCPACGYDLRGSDSKTCPECGMVVRT